jgi:hypothetical protein
MDSWIVRRDGNDISVPDVSTIQRWAEAGYLKEGDLIFRPASQEWMRLDQVPEINECRRANGAEVSGNPSSSLDGDLLIRQGGREYRAPNLETLQVWVSEGRILPESTFFDPQSGRWSYIRTLPGMSIPPSAAPLRVVDVARNYRQLVVWLGIQILFSIWFALADSLAILVGPVLVATVFALAYYAHETAKALGSTSALIWAAAMLVPCVNLFTLLALSSRATEVCKANGIRVGLFGPEL